MRPAVFEGAHRQRRHCTSSSSPMHAPKCPFCQTEALSTTCTFVQQPKARTVSCMLDSWQFVAGVKECCCRLRCVACRWAMSKRAASEAERPRRTARSTLAASTQPDNGLSGGEAMGMASTSMPCTSSGACCVTLLHQLGIFWSLREACIVYAFKMYALRLTLAVISAQSYASPTTSSFMGAVCSDVMRSAWTGASGSADEWPGGTPEWRCTCHARPG